MQQQIISKSQFKPQALEYLRRVEEQKRPIVITHFGKPVVKIVPFSENVEDRIQALRKAFIHFKQPTAPVNSNDWEVLK